MALPPCAVKITPSHIRRCQPLTLTTFLLGLQDVQSSTTVNLPLCQVKAVPSCPINIPLGSLDVTSSSSLQVSDLILTCVTPINSPSLSAPVTDLTASLVSPVTFPLCPMPPHPSTSPLKTTQTMSVRSQCTALLNQKSGFRGVSDSSFSPCAEPTYYCVSKYFYNQFLEFRS